MRHAIEHVADALGLDGDSFEPYSWEFGKVTWSGLAAADVLGPARSASERGKLVLVTAINPTPQGEGKTTTSIGLADGLRLLGKRAVVALREPSLGPSFGQKGGGTGGGEAQLEPSDRINLHFTGDIHAVTSANNLLAAMIDNALHFGTTPLDSRRITFRRALDMDDRSLRGVVVGLGGRTGGMPREEGFVISAASEVMAILGLADGLADLERRLGAIVVGFSRDGSPVRAQDLGAASPMAALLADALRPNLAHTRAGTPAIVHAGPFANIAHGTSSILGTRLALARADVVVTEAGFGADLGAEKFIDLVAPIGGFTPDAIVVVATVKALAYHGGADKVEGTEAQAAALERGLRNLGAHLNTLARTGIPLVVGLNRFADDTEAAIERVRAFCSERGVPLTVNTAYGDGPEGARALAEVVLERLAQPRPAGGPVPFYAPGTATLDALDTIATSVYGAEGVIYERGTRATMRRYTEAGYGTLPVCVAKTQYSLTDDPSVRNVPTEPWHLHVRDLRLSAGAGFVVAVTGEIMTMPGLPRVPQAVHIGVTPTGEVVGIR